MGAIQVGATWSGVPRFSFYAELRERQPVLAAFSFLMVAAIAPTLVAMAIDARLFNGISVWLKPFKFELSTVVHMVTLAWFWPYLDERLRRSLAVRGAAWMIGLIFVAEVGYIAFRASLAEGSHFNTATPAAAIAYPVMGAAILVAVGLSGWISILFCVRPRARSHRRCARDRPGPHCWQRARRSHRLPYEPTDWSLGWRRGERRGWTAVVRLVARGWRPTA